LEQSNLKFCPIHNTFDLIGKKFTILILRDMMLYGRKRFNELLASVEGVNSKTLSLRIREMERDGLIKRHVYPGMPLRVEYELTEKAKNLRPVLEQMGEFSTRYCASDVFRDKRPRSFQDALKGDAGVTW
jgi:DNA-binding HxlR family transcriptional regulator